MAVENDYISRQAAISALDRAVCDYCVCLCDKPYSKKCNAVDNYSAGIRVIEDLPSADVRENVHGEWKRTVTGHPYCSSCNWFPEENEMTGFFYDFCPNCGADMRGDK